MAWKKLPDPPRTETVRLEEGDAIIGTLRSLRTVPTQYGEATIASFSDVTLFLGGARRSLAEASIWCPWYLERTLPQLKGQLLRILRRSGVAGRTQMFDVFVQDATPDGVPPAPSPAPAQAEEGFDQIPF